MVKDKKRVSWNLSEELVYYDHLAYLFERVAWITILWALVINLFSLSTINTKNYTYLLLFIASVFNLFYFRYFYRLVREKDYRFYLAEIFFPLLVWVFIHLHSEFLSYLLLPYYILILATSLTLKRKDVALALGAALTFVLFETVILPPPMGSNARVIGLGQTASLLVFTWVALKLSHLVLEQRVATVTIRDEILKEEKKSSILKEYTSELILDRQKAQVLLDEYPGALLLLDNKNRLLETNTYFKKLSDFKDERLLGKDLGYVLKLETPLNFEQKSYVPEDFEGMIMTRRNKLKKVHGRAHFLLGQNQRLKQVLILLTT